MERLLEKKGIKLVDEKGRDVELITICNGKYFFRVVKKKNTQDYEYCYTIDNADGKIGAKQVLFEKSAVDTKTLYTKGQRVVVLRANVKKPNTPIVYSGTIVCIPGDKIVLPAVDGKEVEQSATSFGVEPDDKYKSSLKLTGKTNDKAFLIVTTACIFSSVSELETHVHRIIAEAAIIDDEILNPEDEVK
jgi:hypothetical protein